MKKVIIFTVVFLLVFSSVAYGMTYQEFIDSYPNEYIYRVNFPSGAVNYFSSPYELEFRTEDVFDGEVLESGKSFVVYKTTSPFEIVYRLKNNGGLYVWDTGRLEIIDNPNNLVGYEGDIDIYRWNGYGFFLPLPSVFLRVLGGPILTILLAGFGIVSVMLLVRLLTGYFQRYLHRSL